MEAADFACACEKEIEELHAFFVAWFNGAVPDSDASWARVSDALAPRFVLIAPSGQRFDRESILAGIRGRYGTHGPSADFAIWTQDYQARHVGAGQALVTYEEWQRRDGGERGRLSTAAFLADERAPNEVCWLHVHETWLPGA